MDRLIAGCSILVLAACVSYQTRFVAARVRGGGGPLGDTLVLLSCQPARYAQKTDAHGHACVQVRAREVPGVCQVLAARPGFATVEVPEVPLHAGTCPPPIEIELSPLRGEVAGPEAP